MVPTPEDAARFWEKVAVGYPDECWFWLGGGAEDERGVGQFWFDGGVVRAPQFAWTLANGGQAFPAGLVACHTCDNPPCCNPKHIWAGTQQANVDDMISKGRHPHGVTHGASKITEDQVREIRAAGAAGLQSYAEIGAPLGLSKWQVSNIVRRKHWDHVE